MYGGRRILSLCLWVGALWGQTRFETVARLPVGFESRFEAATMDGCIWLVDRKDRLLIADSGRWGEWGQPVELPHGNARIYPTSCRRGFATTEDKAAWVTKDGGVSWSEVALPAEFEGGTIVDMREVEGRTVLSGFKSVALPAGEVEDRILMWAVDGKVFVVQIYVSQEDGAGWKRARFKEAVAGEEEYLLRAVKIAGTKGDQLFFVQDAMFFGIDLAAGKLSDQVLKEKCDGSGERLPVTDLEATNVSCSREGQCILVDHLWRVFERDRDQKTWCLSAMRFWESKPREDARQVVHRGDHVLWLGWGGNVWRKHRTAGESIRMLVPPAGKLLTAGERVFAVSDGGIVEIFP